MLASSWLSARGRSTSSRSRNPLAVPPNSPASWSTRCCQRRMCSSRSPVCSTARAYAEQSGTSSPPPARQASSSACCCSSRACQRLALAASDARVISISSPPRSATPRWAYRNLTSASWSPFRASRSAWTLLVPPDPPPITWPARGPSRSGASRPPPRARADARLEVTAEPFDQGGQMRLVAFGGRQVVRDARRDLIERLAELPVHVVPPDLPELAPVAPDGREVLRQVPVELHEVGPELRQRVDIVDNPGHACSPDYSFPGRWQVPSNSAAISSRLTLTISGYFATPPEAMCSTRLLYGTSTS